MNISIFDIMGSMEILHSKRMTDYSKYKNFHILHNAVWTFKEFNFWHTENWNFDILHNETYGNLPIHRR